MLVSGAAGSIGSELVRQIQCYEPQATLLVEMAESPLHDLMLDLQKQFPKARFIPVIADVRNRARMEQIFAEMRPDVVYHAAAYKHVPLMESFPNEAILANVSGTKNMADLAVKYGVKRFVMISTDKAVNPTNIMGASKRIAEIYVQSLFRELHAKDPKCTKFITTRFGNVLGSNGSVFVPVSLSMHVSHIHIRSFWAMLRFSLAFLIVMVYAPLDNVAKTAAGSISKASMPFFFVSIIVFAITY